MRAQIPFFILVFVMLGGAPQLCFAADLGFRNFGLRGGISMNPDQFQGGIFINAGRIVPELRFQPSFEIGIGNGVRVVSANFDALYPLGGRSWRPYVGGGPGINFVDVTNGVGQGRGMEIKLALNVVGGVEWGRAKRGARAPHRYVLEARLGLGNTPDFKITAGLTF